MSIRRKAVPHVDKENEPLELELLSAFPRPPSGNSSTERLVLQNTGPTPRPWNYGFISTRHTEGIDADSLYDEPGPPPPPVHERKAYATQDMVAPSLRPDAELQLVPDNPSRVYAPGDTITGYVLGRSTPEEHIHIILHGHSSSTLKDAKTLNIDRTPLLFQSMYLEYTSRDSVPRFEIKIPYACGSAERDWDSFLPGLEPGRSYWTTKWPFQDSFESEAGHPLPPSLYTGPHRAQALSNVQGQASISYSLVAVRSSLDSESNSFKPSESFQLPLTLTTRRLSPSKIHLLKRETCSFVSKLSIQTTALSKERKLSLREQFRDAFNTAAPTFYFQVNVTTPRLSTPGADVKIGIALEVLPPPPGHLYNFPIPDITIASIAFRVRSYTGVRAIPVFAPSQPSPGALDAVCKKETFKQTELTQTQTPTNATFEPRDGDFKDQVCVATLLLPQEMTPSFKTYNAWKGYRLECAVRVHIVGKEEEVKVISDLDVVAGEDTNIRHSRAYQGPVDDRVNRQLAETFVKMGAGM